MSGIANRSRDGASSLYHNPNNPCSSRCNRSRGGISPFLRRRTDGGGRFLRNLSSFRRNRDGVSRLRRNHPNPSSLHSLSSLHSPNNSNNKVGDSHFHLHKRAGTAHRLHHKNSGLLQMGIMVRTDLATGGNTERGRPFKVALLL